MVQSIPHAGFPRTGAFGFILITGSRFRDLPEWYVNRQRQDESTERHASERDHESFPFPESSHFGIA